MLLREYTDRYGFKRFLNLESICSVNCDTPYDNFDDLGYDEYLTIWFAGTPFDTTKEGYLKILDEINEANNPKCRYGDGEQARNDSKEDFSYTEKVEDPTEGMRNVQVFIKRKIMEADYMDADAKIRLLADLDIIM